MAVKVPIAKFVESLTDAFYRKDGYIMGSQGQNPKKWAKDSWWFTQYTDAKQREKALYWREHAQRVWDCNGMAEGIYKDFTGTDINSKARFNYAQWCDPKGKGMIPVQYRVPGAAVFWGDTASSIHHVAYLVKPVSDGKPDGDWYLVEARGVLYGVVATKLLSRKPNFWGLMTKYFDYSGAADVQPTVPAFGSRTLRNGSEGEDVKELQQKLIELGYDCGRWGADGDFGDATEMAVMAFQRDAKIDVDGIVGAATVSAIEKAISDKNQPPETAKAVQIFGGNCWVRTMANTDAQTLGVARNGEEWPYAGETTQSGWNKIVWNNRDGWVSGKYSRVI